MSQECKLLTRALQGKNRFQKQSFTDLKIDVLKNFVNFTEKYVLEPLLNKVAGLNVSNSIKKKTSIQVFSCKICKVSKNIFFYRTATVVASEV